MVLRRIKSVLSANRLFQFIRSFYRFAFLRSNTSLLAQSCRFVIVGPPMELRQLRYFATVARELNFTRAAARLHVAQPALSRQIKQLEEELGVPLLVRDNRKVSLTARGESFLGEAESILQQSERAMQKARTGELRSVNVAYVWGLFHSMVPRALLNFRKIEPDLAVNLFDMSAAEQSRALSAGRVDVGFIGLAHEAETAKLEKHGVGTTHFIIALPQNHRLAKSRSIDLSGLGSDVFLLISDEHFPGASQIIRSACTQAGFNPRTLRAAERGHTILSLVAAGCGVALLPEPLAALPHPGVVFRQPAGAVEADLFVAFRKGLEPSLRASLLRALKDTS
jgi:DNA-binding transcriptional LysR family regulator